MKKESKMREIGSSGIYTDVYYVVGNREKLELGSHVEKNEKADYKSIKLYRDIYYSGFMDNWVLSYEFFIDSRAYGIGGTLVTVMCSKRKPTEADLRELDEKASEKLKELDLKVDKEKTVDAIKEEEESLEALKTRIDKLKSLIEIN